MKIPGRFLVPAGASRRIRVYLIALWKLFRHPETPRAARWVAIAVIAYAVSPIDLIPDFIPVLGQLDDLIIIPLGVALAVRMTPKPLWEAMLREAETSTAKLPPLIWGAVAIVVVWVALIALVVWAVRAW
ncbi:MAG: YkvA family protein [Caldimonas sp.]